MAENGVGALVGPRGSGKSHEGVLQILEQLRKGRFVVAVIPTLDVDKVAEYLKDDTVHDRLKVVDYEEVDRPDFWPDERRMKLVAGQPGPYFDPTAWRSSVVPAGAIVYIDEAWRWLENAKTIPAPFRHALSMARHWRGPADWRDADARARWLSDDDLWHPGLGGDIFKGGDGTDLIALNIVLITQTYETLDSKLRRQVSQITQLKSFRDNMLPPFLMRMMGLTGHYGHRTFDGHKIPTKAELAADPGLGNWKKKPHVPEIHELFEYAGGQALEVSVDDSRSYKNSAQYRKFRNVIRGLVVFLVLFVVGGWAAWHFLASPVLHKMGVLASDKKPAAVSKYPEDGSEPPTGQSGGQVPPGPQRPPPPPPKPVMARVVGDMDGSPIVLDENGLVRIMSTDAFINTDAGPSGSVDGVQVSKWSAPVVAGRVAARPAGNARTGLMGVGKALAGAYSTGGEVQR